MGVRKPGLSTRALALVLAVGLSGLLVGLSVAPSVLPGDTLHVPPRSAAGASVVVSVPGDLAVHASVGAAAHIFTPDQLADAVLSVALVVGWTAFAHRPRRHLSLPGLAASAGRSRAPPAH